MGVRVPPSPIFSFPRPCEASNFSANFRHPGVCVGLDFVSTHLPVVDCADDQKENYEEAH